MDTAETLTSAGETALNVLTTIQEKVLDLTKTAAEAVPAQLSSIQWLPADAAEQARGVIEEAFTLQTKLLEANQKFARNLFETLAPKAEPVTADA